MVGVVRLRRIEADCTVGRTKVGDMREKAIADQRTR